MDGPDTPWFCILKRIRSRSLDHDRAVQMRSSPFHLDRYNASQFDTSSDRDSVVRAPRDRRASIDRPPNPTLSTRPRHLRLIKTRDLVPHRKRKRISSGIIYPFPYRQGWRQIYIYIYIYVINIRYKYTRHVGTARVRVALPRGPECHVASTQAPRPFFIFLFIKNGFKNRK